MSAESPSFLELFEFWLQEKYQGYVKIATWDPDKDTFDLVIRVPNDEYTKFTHTIVGGIDGHDVTLFIYTAGKYFNLAGVNSKISRFNGGRYDTKNAADPELFPWFEETLKRENYQEMSKIEKLL